MPRTRQTFDSERQPMMTAESWGMTNDYRRVEAAIAYREAAKADGWIAEPIYKNESIDQACALTRDGFTINILTRTNCRSNRYKYQASVSIWGPDRLIVKPSSYQYNWPLIRDGVRCCHECGATDVYTTRVSFAGRVCKPCLPTARAKHEKPGWDN